MLIVSVVLSILLIAHANNVEALTAFIVVVQLCLAFAAGHTHCVVPSRAKLAHLEKLKRLCQEREAMLPSCALECQLMKLSTPADQCPVGYFLCMLPRTSNNLSDGSQRAAFEIAAERQTCRAAPKLLVDGALRLPSGQA